MGKIFSGVTWLRLVYIMIHMNSATIPNENLQSVIDGTESDSSGTTITGGAIEHFRVITVITTLALEINTGMRSGRYSLLEVASEYGVIAKTKKKALRGMLAYYKDFYGVEFEDKYGRIAQALAK